MSRLIHKLRYRFSEPYRIRVGRGLFALRSNKEQEAVIDFCKKALKDKQNMKFNPERKRIYEMTIRLNEHDSPKLIKWKPVKAPIFYNDVDDFIEDHSGWYWD